MICEGLEEFGIVLAAAKNEANERVISSGRVKVMVVPTNEELAVARDTQRILTALGPKETAAPAKPAAPSTFTPDELAKLVLLWAKHRQADPAALAAMWGREVGRSVDAAAVQRELERLSLAAAVRPAKKSAKTK